MKEKFDLLGKLEQKRKELNEEIIMIDFCIQYVENDR